jgi:hypothetical protein
MNVYIYDADIYCDDCGEKIIAELDAEHVQDTGDSGDYPQGPYPDGGGEADVPQHCGSCQIFLENPLTEDGYQYVCDALADNRGNAEIEKLWANFYYIYQAED